MKIIKKILCWFGFHDWKSIERKSIEWIMPDDQELYEVISKCSRCKKESKIMSLIIKIT